MKELISRFVAWVKGWPWPAIVIGEAIFVVARIAWNDFIVDAPIILVVVLLTRFVVKLKP